MATYFHNDNSESVFYDNSQPAAEVVDNNITLPTSTLVIQVAEGGTVPNNHPDLLAWIAEASADAGEVTTNLSSFSSFSPGAAIITFSADNAQSRTASFSVVEVLAPAFTAPTDITVQEGQQLTFDFTLENYSGAVSASRGTVTNISGTNYRFSYPAGYNYDIQTSDTITLIADDGINAAESASVSITVANVYSVVINNAGPLAVDVPYGGSITIALAQAWASQFTNSTANTLANYTFPLGAGTYPVVFSAHDALSVTANIVVSQGARPDPVITLPVDSVSILELSNFTSPTAQAVDADGVDISSSVQVTGTVDTNIPGNYTLMYSVIDGLGQSASIDLPVTVLVDPDRPKPVDIYLPLAGNHPAYNQSLLWGQPWQPPVGEVRLENGDAVDAEVLFAGSVDPQTPGSYVIIGTIDDPRYELLQDITLTVTVTSTPIVVPDRLQLIDVVPAQYEPWEFDTYESEVWPCSIDFGPQAAVKVSDIESVIWESKEADARIDVIRSYHNNNIAYAVLDTGMAGPGLVKITCRFANGEQRVRYVRLNVIALY